MAEYQTICTLAEIPEGEARMFDVDGTMVGLFHVGGKLFAIANSCPHAGASLAHGLLDGATVRCRIHHWRFCLRTGAYLDENKPEFNARTFPVRVDGGSVQVKIE